MIRQLGISQPNHDGVILTNGIAYSLEELLWRIDYGEFESSMPVNSRTLFPNLPKAAFGVGKLARSTERWIRKIVAGRNWAIQPAHPGET